jgi:hypothetical protein
MIEAGQLKLHTGKRHRPRDPAVPTRKLVAALLYEASDGDGNTSDQRFRDVAAQLGMSEQSVRAAYTELRKSNQGPWRQPEPKS